MRTTTSGHSYFFTDESGDPVFYDARGNLIVGQDGCSKLLIVGFIETQEPAVIRKGVLELQREVCSEPYFKNIPSLSKTAVAFHAKDDAPEIRYLFYKRLREFNFKAQFLVARKLKKYSGMISMPTKIISTMSYWDECSPTCYIAISTTILPFPYVALEHDNNRSPMQS